MASTNSVNVLRNRPQTHTKYIQQIHHFDNLPIFDEPIFNREA